MPALGVTQSLVSAKVGCYPFKCRPRFNFKARVRFRVKEEVWKAPYTRETAVETPGKGTSNVPRKTRIPRKRRTERTDRTDRTQCANKTQGVKS